MNNLVIKIKYDNLLDYRYEAATIIKNLCLKDRSLGEILQILYMAINIKKWIIHHQSGWQPINITLAETNPDSGC